MLCEGVGLGLVGFVTQIPSWLLLLDSSSSSRGAASAVQTYVRAFVSRGSKEDAQNDATKFVYGVVGFVIRVFIVVVSAMYVGQIPH